MNLGFESEKIEFKLSTGQTSRALESITAMLNKSGKAKILFGVNDKGDVVGLDIGNKTIKDLSQAITTRIKPQIIPIIRFEIYDEKTIIVVEASGNNKPYSADGNYLIRSGCENKKIDPELLKELVFSNSKEYITELESFNQDLTFYQLKDLYRSSNLTIDDSTFNRNTGLLTQNGKFNELADMLSDNNNISIKVIRFDGKDKSNMVVRNEYGYKCLLIAMQQALDYVRGLNETRVELNGSLQRKEIHLFDEISLREAWTNACLHTRWSKMIPPAIYIFDDRIEIISTGGLPVDFSKEEFFEGISHPVNRQLQKIMGQLRIVETTGHGVLEIIKRNGKEAFTITDNHIIVTLKFPFEISSKILNYDELTVNQKKILLIIKSKPEITTSDLSKESSLSTSSISNILKELKQAKYIERIGSNKSGYWKVNK